MIYQQVGSFHAMLTLVSQCNSGWFFSVLINNGERELLFSSLFYVNQIFMLSHADPKSAPDEPELVQDSSCFWSFFLPFCLVTFFPLQIFKVLIDITFITSIFATWGTLFSPFINTQWFTHINIGTITRDQARGAICWWLSASLHWPVPDHFAGLSHSLTLVPLFHYSLCFLGESSHPLTLPF